MERWGSTFGVEHGRLWQEARVGWPGREPDGVSETENRGLIPFFTGYAVIVWWLAGKYRRSLLGFTWVLVGAAFIAMVIYGHYAMGVVTQGRIHVEVLQPILYGYGAMVTGMGLFIACLPRRVEHGPRCHACDYDMRAISPTVCPECGTQVPVRDPALGVRPISGG